VDVFVLVALALAVLALGAVVVAGVALVRAVKELSGAARAAGERVAPLTDELRAEQAVTLLEVDALQRSLARRPVRTHRR
jgi:hypothetical protein